MVVLGLSTYERAEVLRNEVLITCRDGHTYSIGIDSSGSTKVLPCAALKAVAQVECFVKF
jgi:hypothetical protein